MNLAADSVRMYSQDRGPIQFLALGGLVSHFSKSAHGLVDQIKPSPLPARRLRWRCLIAVDGVRHLRFALIAVAMLDFRLVHF